MNKFSKIEEIRNKIFNGGFSLGSWIQIPNSSIAEIMGNAGYDWVAIDLEHGSINLNQLPDLFRSLELGETLPLARISDKHYSSIQSALDAGAGGIIVPNILNANEMREIIKYACWPPSGNRGVGFSRANLFGEKFNDYKKIACSPIVVGMIEHIEAINNLESILDVKGLDGIFIGPYDLSASMNIVGEFNNLEFKKVLDEVISKTSKAKKFVGIHIVEPNKNDMEKRISEGYNFIANSMDSVFIVKSCQAPQF